MSVLASVFVEWTLLELVGYLLMVALVFPVASLDVTSLGWVVASGLFVVVRCRVDVAAQVVAVVVQTPAPLFVSLTGLVLCWIGLGLEEGALLSLRIRSQRWIWVVIWSRIECLWALIEVPLLIAGLCVISLG